MSQEEAHHYAMDKSLKVEVSKTKELGLELSKSKGTMRKLQEDLDKQVACL